MLERPRIIDVERKPRKCPKCGEPVVWAVTTFFAVHHIWACAFDCYRFSRGLRQEKEIYESTNAFQRVA